jgi:hypothetical protein
MDRRAFVYGSLMTLGAPVLLAVMGLSLLADPLPAQGQSQAAPRLIAYLSGNAPALSRKCTSDPPTVPERAFLEGLNSLGYRDGEKIVIECRYAESKTERLDALAAQAVKFRVVATYDGNSKVDADSAQTSL